VVKQLPSRCEALSSSPCTANKTKQNKIPCWHKMDGEGDGQGQAVAEAWGPNRLWQESR
jgi:hypothetical protein